MALTILDVLFVGDGLIGLIGIFYPEFLFKFINLGSEKKYDKKKDAWKYRLIGLAAILIGIALYIFDNYY